MNGYGVNDAEPPAAPDESWIWASDQQPPSAPNAAPPPGPNATPVAEEPATRPSQAPREESGYDRALAEFYARMANMGTPVPPPEGPRAATVDAEPARGHPARLALGMAALAAERIGSPANGAVTLGIGFAQQTANGLRGLADRMVARRGWAALRTLDRAARRAGLRANAGPLVRRRARLDRLVAEARERGQATVDVGRAAANDFLRASVNDAIEWAQTRAVPQVADNLVPHLVDSVGPRIVDGLVPHLVETVVPQLIDGVMPEIRARVLPVIMEDMAKDPRLRDLMLEQSRGALGEAAKQVRTSTASADDRVEQVFRRLVRGGGGQGPADQANGEE